MENKEVRELVLHLAGALLDAIGELEEAQDVFTPNKYANEMAVYDRAAAWLREQNKA